MTLKSLGLFATAFILTTASFGQTENSVDVTPHWKSNETHSVKNQEYYYRQQHWKTRTLFINF